MTLDKFGKYLHKTPVRVKLDARAKVFFAEDVSNLHYETMLYMMGIYNHTKGYALLNSTNFEYVVPLTQGIIKQVKYHPTDAQIFLNDTLYDAESLIGVPLKKGDKFKAKKPGSKDIFIFEAVISVPAFSQ